MSEQAQTAEAGTGDEGPPANTHLAAMGEGLKPLIDSVQKSGGLLGPYDVADHLKARIDEFDFRRCHCPFPRARLRRS
ncbi:MAG: hypothetical protein F4Y86_08820 [Gammaproteobacteria bacterium]|nr:hypothetical protein [Gammaproteobacteria bacterium]